MKRILLLLIFSVCASFKIFSQGEIPVSMYTGSPQITVPIGTVTSHDISVPIYLAYDATGVRVRQPNGIYGLGWNLVAGGSITRQIKDVPDDLNSPYGWIYNNGSQAVMANDVNNSIIPFNSTNSCPVTDNNEPAVQSKINSYYTSGNDTEPDVFSFNFPGYSGKFVFDNSATPTIHLIPWQDVNITYTKNAISQAITEFVITTNDGVQYTFDQGSNELRTTTKTSNNSLQEVSMRDYNTYKNGLSYTTEWTLTKIVSPSGGKVTFNYTSQSVSETDTVRAFVPSASPLFTTHIRVDIFTNKRSGFQAQLSSITGLSGNSAAVSSSAIVFSDTRRSGNQIYKTFNLGYYTDTNGHTFLKNITETSGCDQKPPYNFLYHARQTDDPQPDGVSLPPIWSRGVDFWGYYNGIATNSNLAPTVYVYPQLPAKDRFRLVPMPSSYAGPSYTLPGANRNPSATGIMAGTLYSIQYPTGGTTNIIYEPNQYYDATLQQSVMGGGIRIKSFTYFDGMNTAAAITKMFSYTDSTGQSSGRLISKPVFAEPVIQYIDPLLNTPTSITAGNWISEIIRSENDLSGGETTYGSAVGYTDVTVSRPSSGYAHYQFLLPGTYGDAPIGAWAPSTDGFARSNNPCPLFLGDIITTPTAWQFPYSQSADFDYERGLAWQVREYDNSNNLVRKTRTYYQYIYNTGTAPYNVYGLRYEKFPNDQSTNPTFLFSKYTLLTDAAKVKYREQVNVYDASNTSKFNASVTEYDYLSNAHHLLTQVQTTTPDGTVYVNQTRYPKDYASNGTDMASQMIAALQSSFRNGTPIEKYSYVLKPGDVNRYTGGSLIKFGNFGGTVPLPQYTYSLNLQTPLTSFDYSYVDPGTLTFHNNANYELTRTFTSFDAYGNVQTSFGQDQIPTTTAWGYGGSVPVLSARNASFGQFAFSDFETTTGSEFSVNQTIFGAGRTGANALNASSVVLNSKVIQKAAPTYVFSLWLNSTTGTSFNIYVQNTSGTVYYNTTQNWTSTGNGFQYFETNLPIDPSLSSFVVVVVSSSSSSLIDDVSLYPQSADLTTSTYTFPYGASAVTANGNITKQTVYDGLGRQKYVIDTYGNIREKDSYQYQNTSVPALSSAFTFPTQPDFGVLAGTTVFTAANCVDGATYQWAVTYTGSGAPASPPTITGYNPVQALTFAAPIAAPGSYTATVTLTVTHPLYGASTPVSTSSQFTVELPPAIVNLCANGAEVVCVTTWLPTATYSCASLPTPGNPTGTNFGVTGVSNLSGPETVTSYNWQDRPTGTTSWTSRASTSTYQVQKINAGQTGYDVQCLITTSYGRAATSTVLSVTVANPCN